MPAQIDDNSIDPTSQPASEEFPQTEKNNERRNAFSAESEETPRKGHRPPPTGFVPPKVLPTYNQEFRNREEARAKQLGVPLQAQASNQFSRQNNQFTQTKKPVVRTFDPDKNFAAFEHIIQRGKTATHKDYDFSRYFTKKEGQGTAAPLRRQDVVPAFNKLQTGFVKQTVTTKRPFANFNTQPPTTRRTVPPTPRQFPTQRPVQAVTTRATTRATTTTRRPTTTRATQAPALNQKQQFNQPQNVFNRNQQNNQINRFASVTTPSRQAFNQNAISSKKTSVKEPARDLLPPLDATRNYEDGTTKGPSIYSEWKIPDTGLQPPRLDNETEDAQSKRSILEEGNFENGNVLQTSESRRLGNGNSIKVQYKDLQKKFAIPQIDFPLEQKGRDGYENVEAVNSFQVKIPYKSGNAERYYYLEHNHCNPECHPYFFKPGRCEPCIKL